jgi:hypothetical protein
MPTIFRDYETRSTADLGDVGVWQYSTDPSTDVWCCAYCVDNGPVELWLPSDSVPAAFISAAENPDWLVAAFVDQFERLVEQHVMAPRYCFPVVPAWRTRSLPLWRALRRH